MSLWFILTILSWKLTNPRVKDRNLRESYHNVLCTIKPLLCSKHITEIWKKKKPYKP